MFSKSRDQTYRKTGWIFSLGHARLLIQFATYDRSKIMAKPILFLHVGAPKCASSTVQYVLTKYYQSDYFGLRESGALAALASPRRLPFSEVEIASAEERAKSISSNLIISHESFFSARNNGVALIERLFPNFSVRTLIISRSPERLLESTLLQFMRTCIRFPATQERMHSLILMGHEAALEYTKNNFLLSESVWSEFGQLFKCQLERNDLGEGIADWLNDKRAKSLTNKTPRQNLSMTPVTFEILRRYYYFKWTQTHQAWSRLIVRIDKIVRNADLESLKIIEAAELSEEQLKRLLTELDQ